MGTYLNGTQATVAGILTMVGTVVHGTLDALVGRTGTAAVGAVLHHLVLPREDFSNAEGLFHRSPQRDLTLKGKIPASSAPS